MTLEWYKQTDKGDWYGLNIVNLSDDHFNDLYGVYIIYYVIDNTVYILYAGQGNIRDRLYAHRSDNTILNYTHHTLYVTWAKVPLINDRDRIEAYIHQQYTPKLVERTPDAIPLVVNLPWKTD